MAKKRCLTCNEEFVLTSNAQRYCCTEHVPNPKRDSTFVQYSRISGNWERYFSRILKCQSNREALTRDFLLELLERQNYRCALSGELLTCTLIPGTVVPTNASIDRIVAGGPYEPNNVQLVCSIVNKMKWDMTVDEFLQWCRNIVANDGGFPE